MGVNPVEVRVLSAAWTYDKARPEAGLSLARLLSELAAARATQTCEAKQGQRSGRGQLNVKAVQGFEAHTSIHATDKQCAENPGVRASTGSY